MTTILGVSAFYHDAAACIVRDGVIVAAAQEERLTRVKFDPSPPRNALRVCLSTAGLTIADLDHLAFYEDPTAKLARILWSLGAGIGDARSILSTWDEKVKVEPLLRAAFLFDGPIHWIPHHRSHAASAYLVSPFEDAAILVGDGVGEWAASSLWRGRDGDLELIDEVRFPDSLGLYYSAITSFLGFQTNSDEYKVMGLAAYGKPRYVEALRSLLDVQAGGRYRLDMTFLDYNHDMFAPALGELVGMPPRRPGDPVLQEHMDLASSAQGLLEQALLGAAWRLYEETGSRNLCLAGGVALNCVANTCLLEETPFEHVFVQPASGDAGGSLGAAVALHQQLGLGRVEPMRTALLGPAHSDEAIGTYLRRLGVVAERLAEPELLRQTAEALAGGQIVGWFQGRMEFGPRALGARSILADPRGADMKDELNLRIKQREPFRPFAPVCRTRDAPEFFGADREYPFMTMTVAAREPALIPAAVHVDGTARLQTVDEDTNPLLAGLLAAFGRLTGVPVLINTSFNLAGEPIVCSPQDAFSCFRESGIDALAMGPYLIRRDRQPAALIAPGSRPYMALARETVPYTRDTYFFS